MKEFTKTKEISKSAMADLELINAIKNKNTRAAEKAFSTLFKKYNNPLLFTFKGLIKDEEKARGLVLDAFIKINDNLEKFNENNAVFSTWLFKITQNLFIDCLRKKGENLVSLTDLASFDDESHIVEYGVPCKDGTPETKIISFERNQKIVEIIDSMENQDLATVIKLKYFEGHSYAKIAKITGKPEGTVKAFLYRAKQILKVEFERNNIDF
jgi:RNA polymerase sigma-70 factor (ECF subfamily)